MNKKYHIKNLERIKNRYLAWPADKPQESRIAHFISCEIFRSKEVYGYATCNCGMLFDLRALPGQMASKIYPRYHKDYTIAETTWEDQQKLDNETDEERKTRMDEATKSIEAAFGPIQEPTPEQIAEDDAKEWKFIQEVFGEEFTTKMRNVTS